MPVATHFPIQAVRDEFPSLAVTDDGRARIYLDNPAGTQVPQRVIGAIADFLRTSNANLGGFFSTSIDAEAIVHRAFTSAAAFVGAGSEREIVFGPSMTSLTFTFSRSLGRTLRAGDEIVVTRMDHDGNVAPWLAVAQERGAVVRWADFDRETWRIEARNLEAVLSDRTKIVALNYASNMTGSVNDVAALAAKARAAGALVYVDAVQYAPHRVIDVSSLGCDFLVCSPYKFYGPHMGVLWGREDLLREIYVYKVRPVPNDLPHRFEVGTPQLELLAGLGATIEHFEWIAGILGANGDPRSRIVAAYDAIAAWERGLMARLVAGLCAMPALAVRGITDERDFDSRVPTISFTHASRSSAQIASDLAARGIFVWSGHNFALETARALGLDEEDGVVRIGLAQYTTQAEVDVVLTALREII